jgi:hypothetical protein
MMGIVAATTIGWITFAFAGLYALATFEAGGGLASMGLWNWLFVLLVFLAAPTGLVLGWSLILQGGLPTKRQVRLAAKVILLLAAAIGLFALWAVVYTVRQ